MSRLTPLAGDTPLLIREAGRLKESPTLLFAVLLTVRFDRAFQVAYFLAGEPA